MVSGGIYKSLNAKEKPGDDMKVQIEFSIARSRNDVRWQKWVMKIGCAKIERNEGQLEFPLNLNWMFIYTQKFKLDIT